MGVVSSFASNFQATTRTSRPLAIALLNLMPDKQDAENQFSHWLQTGGRRVEITPLRLSSYQPKHAPDDYLDRYVPFSTVQHRHFDGLIVTGAPLGKHEFKQGGENGIEYWDELCRLYNWSTTHVGETLSVCWAAAAALKHFHNVTRRLSKQKLFGVYPQQVHRSNDPLAMALGPLYPAPVSRYSYVHPEQVSHLPQLDIISSEATTGLGLVRDRKNRQLLSFNHFEYDAERLANEYWRDEARGFNPALPLHYSLEKPLANWAPAARKVMHSWLDDLSGAQEQVQRISFPNYQYV